MKRFEGDLRLSTKVFGGCKSKKICYNGNVYHHNYSGEFMKKIFGFTLAEVLITLGIIGVVAALTIPVLMQKYKNQVVETRLKKFYTSINQAIKMSESQNGPKEFWYASYSGAVIGDDGKPIEGTSQAQAWFENYIGKYMNILKYETLSDGTFLVYFPDGSSLEQLNRTQSRDWTFYPGDPHKCLEKYNNQVYDTIGRCSFAFQFMPTVSNEYGYLWTYHINKGFEPWRYSWNGDLDELYTDCASNAHRKYCTAIIQNNGWKIPNNYPQKIFY